MRFISRTGTLLIILFISVASCERADTTSLTVAVAGDMSGSNKSFGEQLRDGVSWALRDCQGQTKLELKVFDDRGNPKLAEKTALKIAADPSIVAVVGHATSQTTRQAQNYYSRFEIPLLAPIATYSDLTAAAANKRNVVRLVPSNRAQAQVISDLVLREREHSIARDNFNVLLYHEPGEYGSDLAARIKEAIWNHKIPVLRNEALEERQDGALDLRPVIADVTTTIGIGAVVFAGYYHQARTLVRETTPSLPVDIPIILTDGAKDPALFHELGWSAHRIYISFVSPDWSKREIADRLFQSAGIENARAEQSGFLPLAADAGRLLCGVLGPQSFKTVEEARAYLLNSLLRSDRETAAYTGTYRFGSDGEPVGRTAYLFEVVRNRRSTPFFQEVNLAPPEI